MSKEIQRLDVAFGESTNNYRPGDILTGNVILELRTELKLKGIKITLHGISRVAWDEQRTYTKGSSAKLCHKNMEVYLEESMMITRPGNGLIQSGYHQWPFSFRLPPYIPGAFEGQYGRVQYWTKVHIERPFGKGNIDFSKHFNVLGVLDLNVEADARKEIADSSSTMAGIMCCKSGPINGSIELQKRGFVPAENIPFKADIQNESGRKVAVRVILSQVVMFKCSNKIRKTTTLIKGLSKGDVGPGASVTWEDELRTIPQIPPSRLGGGCKGIDIKYVFTLIVALNGPGKTLEIPLEIIMGTVPLRKTEGTPMLTVKGAAKRAEQGNLDNIIRKGTPVKVAKP